MTLEETRPDRDEDAAPAPGDDSHAPEDFQDLTVEPWDVTDDLTDHTGDLPAEVQDTDTEDLPTDEALEEPASSESGEESSNDAEGPSPDQAAATGGEGDAGEEDEEEQSEAPPELKMVLHVRNGRASAAVWRTGADPHMESFPEAGSLEELFPGLPGLIERANARWAESPMRPKHQPPKPAPRARRRTSRNTPEAAPAAENPEQAETTQQEPQSGMARLF